MVYDGPPMNMLEAIAGGAKELLRALDTVEATMDENWRDLQREAVHLRGLIERYEDEHKTLQGGEPLERIAASLEGMRRLMGAVVHSGGLPMRG